MWMVPRVHFKTFRDGGGTVMQHTLCLYYTYIHIKLTHKTIRLYILIMLAYYYLCTVGTLAVKRLTSSNFSHRVGPHPYPPKKNT